MANSRTSAIRCVIRSVASADGSAATDRELLRRFSRENDQGAFETLVNRHANMVFGVCRRALPTVQDAEDACQATFLVLANRAKDGRWQESVANWLFATARQVAYNAKLASERRAKRETKAVVQEAIEPIDRMTGRELLAALDESLQNLPVRYREPLVLCYLEGLTRDEAAIRLGVPLSTLHTRIDRARKRLHESLTKAGFSLGVGLLTLTVTSPAGAVSPRLVKSIFANASGNVPDTVGELAKGVAVNGSYSKFLLALTAVVVVILGAGLGSLDTSTAGQPPASAASERAGNQLPKDAAAKPAQKEVMLTGRVLDPDGKPLVGAKLFAGRQNSSEIIAVLQAVNNIGRLDELKEVGISGVDGKFAVKVPAGLATNLIARAEGAGLDFLLIPPEQLGKEIELRLVKDHPVRGRILDTQGKPVAGAIVAVSKMDVGKDNSLDGFLADVKRGLPGFSLRTRSKSLSHEAGVLSSATTDKDGRFTIEGAGVERVVTLRVSGAGLAETELLFVNRKDFDPKPYNGVKPAPIGGGGGMPGGPPRATVVYRGPDESVVVETGKRIHGTVTDVDTGKPCVGTKVTLVSDGRMVGWPNVSAITDAEGKYEIRGVRKAKSYAVATDNDPATRYVATQVRVEDTAGYEPLAADLKVKKGVLVTGRMIDTGTNEPVRGFASIVILSENKFVKEYPEFNARTFPTVITGENGTFRIVTIPGPVLLVEGRLGGPDELTRVLTRYKIAVADPKYPQYFGENPRSGSLLFLAYGGSRYGLIYTHFCKVLEIKADAETVAQDVLLEPVK